MENQEHQIVESLSGADDKIITHIPYLLQDLFSLGSDQEILLQLIDRNIEILDNIHCVLDLCCGKGASLISIVKKYKWFGKGIDLFHPFILEARDAALKEKAASYISFEVMDILDAVKSLVNYDLILYGSDAKCLGNEIEALKKISRCLSPAGHIIYDTAYVKDKPFERLLNENGNYIIDKIEHDVMKVKSINTSNTNKIRIRAEQLIEKYPDQKQLLDEYVKAQEEECLELENKYTFATFLLSNRKTV